MKWVTRWRMSIDPKPVLPGVWRMEHGGFLVRARILDGRTREQVTIFRALSTETDPTRALAWLVEEREKVRAGIRRREQPSMLRFCEFAAQLVEAKIKAGDFGSQATKDQWAEILENRLYTTPFAAFFCDQIRASDILAWKETIRIGKGTGRYSPHSANTWIKILRVICKAYVQRYELERNPMLAVPLFETKRWRGRITREQPNSLTPDEFPMFLRLFRELEPEHFAIVALGFALGARPSSLRPIRRSGPEADYDRETGELVLRRSHTRGSSVMESTKNAEDVTVILPKDMREILVWHEATFLVPLSVIGTDRPNLTAAKRAASDLLFPSRTGGLQSSSTLQKPFELVSEAMKKATNGKFQKRITPMGMRRTSKDLLRAAGVRDIVAMAINSHLDEGMHAHYSTVSQREMNEAVAAVIDLAGYREAMGR
jgi:integrase